MSPPPVRRVGVRTTEGLRPVPAAGRSRASGAFIDRLGTDAAVLRTMRVIIIRLIKCQQTPRPTCGP